MMIARTIEIFSSDSIASQKLISLVRANKSDSCRVLIHDVRETNIKKNIKILGIQSIPAIMINSVIMCDHGIMTLKAAGLGQIENS